ncbi:MAG: DNA polymerase III subunit gamma/tau [Rhodospirillales bacterium]|nr:DNA polymerase III subunit gamma/tau [Rhodospirillales bacterium]MBT5112992.1 DNA polymerase III subunit gamma/tau [Rhodospirillales bacterium]MBT5672868.1 DNA polymerase III subunit gamma/tau [Rhodospirillales bacterium]MBT6187545.1 DNA polymerase III subunit gamma/tau [Rhodospirillales bacterium]MBT6743483.1 DNA polymerase III subunit gamma/tau [Rhodospirillales bacterium]
MSEQNGEQDTGTDTGANSGVAYQVLARKYRPQSFSGLIGQEAVVRTLTNAIDADRLAHAWLLTGVRGVGKTTTARIIARALNCIGADGNGGPTPEPCGVCDNCITIAEGRHPDVLEMDAASRTGVDDMRTLIEGVRYRPTSARYKIYIIDEVHMLSTSAFNALLKTLEEPPEHVKFVFATTESRKIPVTVLSRCQRFDLRRVDEDELSSHFAGIAKEEGVDLDPGAVRLIAHAADGSVRDGLSILDQAIASRSGDGSIGEDAVRAMLGLADRTEVFELFESVMSGEIGEALDRLSAQYAAGADGESIMGDLLDLAHWLTRVKITPVIADDPVVPEVERVIGRRLAEGLSMPVLTRAWQMLLKGLSEVQTAPQPMKALEMVLVRIAYAASLPTPAEMVSRLEKAPPVSSAPAPAAPTTQAPTTQAPTTQAPVSAPAPAPAPAETAPATTSSTASSAPQAALQPVPTPETVPATGGTLPKNYEAMLALLDDAREGRLAAELRTQAHLVRFEPPRFEFRPGPNASSNLSNRLGPVLDRLTGVHWGVSLSREEGDPTLSEQAESRDAARKREAAGHPLVKTALETFPGSKITDVRDTPIVADMALDPENDPENEDDNQENDE